MTGIQVEESRRAGVRLEGDQGLAAATTHHLLCNKNIVNAAYLQLMARIGITNLSIGYILVNVLIMLLV